MLDKALHKNPSGTSIDQARLIAARAQLAVALGDAVGARTFQQALQQIPLTAAEREAFRDELQASHDLEQWLTEPSLNKEGHQPFFLFAPTDPLAHFILNSG